MLEELCEYADIIGHDSDDDWLEKRFETVGASEVSAILGKNKYLDRETLLWEKVNRQSGFTGNRNTNWGSHLEERNLHDFCMISDVPAMLSGHVFQSHETPSMTATLDAYAGPPNEPKREVIEQWVSDPDHFIAGLYDVRNEQAPGIIELKQTEIYSTKKWLKEPPEYYWYQVQAQLYVTGAKWAILVGKMGGSDMVIHPIFPDEWAQEEIVQACTEFMDEVKEKRGE